jgi:hypothetical protein
MAGTQNLSRRRAFASAAAVAIVAVQLAAPAALSGAQATPSSEPGAELRVWLLTAAPGDAVWERYGHNAIRVLDTRTGRDVSYNWGIFDFDQVDFIPRFLQGRMLYRMAPFRTDAMVASYAQAGREVIAQELDLTPAQKLALRDFAERNALPENREYIYQYFIDNCSTRVRDLLDLVLGRALREEYEARRRGASYRFHTRRLTQVDPLIYTGMDLLLGPPTDAPISVWDEMFIPMILRDELRSFTVPGPDGVAEPLVIAEETVVASTRAAEPSSPPGWLWIYLLVGVLVGGVLASPGLATVRASRLLTGGALVFAAAWSVFGGVLGLILVGLLFTDHVFSYGNENLFLANPLMLGTAALIALSAFGSRWHAALRTWSRVVAGISLLGFLWHLLPMSSQTNAMFLALGLPAHLGLAWGLGRAAPEPDA